MSDLRCAMCGCTMATVVIGAGFHWECPLCGFIICPCVVTLLREDGSISGRGTFDSMDDAIEWAHQSLAMPGTLATYAILTDSDEEITITLQPGGEWTEEALAADVAHMTEVEERAQLDTERAAEWAVQQFVSQYGEDWLDEGDHGEMAYRRINAREGLTEKEEAEIGAQVDAWSDRGMAWEDIVALEPRVMLLPTR